MSCLFDRWPRRAPRQLAPELAEAQAASGSRRHDRRRLGSRHIPTPKEERGHAEEHEPVDAEHEERLTTFGSTHSSAVFTAVAAAGVIGAIAAGRASDAVGRRAVLVAEFALLTVSTLVLLARSNSPLKSAARSPIRPAFTWTFVLAAAAAGIGTCFAWRLPSRV